MRLSRLFFLAAALILSPHMVQAQDLQTAQALLDRGNYAGALAQAEPICARAVEDGCDMVAKVTTVRGLPSYDPSTYIRITTAACQRPDGAAFCGYAALVASGSAEEVPGYTNWGLVAAPGRRGCSLNDINSCYSMSMLYAAPASPYRNLETSIPYSRKACAADVIGSCFALMTAVQDLPDPALGTYADDYVLAFDRACRLGEQRACAEVPRARLTKERAVQYGAANAVHLLIIDNGIAEGNWGGSVIHAIEESRSPAVIEYAVGKVAAAGQMNYIRPQDLQVIASTLGNSRAGQAARSEMSRRAQFASQNQRPSSTGRSTTSSSTGSSYTPPRSTPTRQQVCTESYTGGGSGVNGRGNRIVTCR